MGHDGNGSQRTATEGQAEAPAPRSKVRASFLALQQSIQANDSFATSFQAALDETLGLAASFQSSAQAPTRKALPFSSPNPAALGAPPPYPGLQGPVGEATPAIDLDAPATNRRDAPDNAKRVSIAATGVIVNSAGQGAETGASSMQRSAVSQRQLARSQRDSLAQEWREQALRADAARDERMAQAQQQAAAAAEALRIAAAAGAGAPQRPQQAAADLAHELPSESASSATRDARLGTGCVPSAATSMADHDVEPAPRGARASTNSAAVQGQAGGMSASTDRASKCAAQKVDEAAAARALERARLQEASDERERRHAEQQQKVADAYAQAARTHMAAWRIADTWQRWRGSAAHAARSSACMCIQAAVRGHLARGKCAQLRRSAAAARAVRECLASEQSDAAAVTAAMEAARSAGLVAEVAALQKHLVRCQAAAQRALADAAASGGYTQYVSARSLAGRFPGLAHALKVRAQPAQKLLFKYDGISFYLSMGAFFMQSAITWPA